MNKKFAIVTPQVLARTIEGGKFIQVQLAGMHACGYEGAQLAKVDDVTVRYTSLTSKAGILHNVLLLGPGTNTIPVDRDNVGEVQRVLHGLAEDASVWGNADIYGGCDSFPALIQVLPFAGLASTSARVIRQDEVTIPRGAFEGYFNEIKVQSARQPFVNEKQSILYLRGTDRSKDFDLFSINHEMLEKVEAALCEMADVMPQTNFGSMIDAAVYTWDNQSGNNTLMVNGEMTDHSVLPLKVGHTTFVSGDRRALRIDGDADGVTIHVPHRGTSLCEEDGVVLYDLAGPVEIFNAAMRGEGKGMAQATNKSQPAKRQFNAPAAHPFPSRQVIQEELALLKAAREEADRAALGVSTADAELATKLAGAKRIGTPTNAVCLEWYPSDNTAILLSRADIVEKFDGQKFGEVTFNTRKLGAAVSKTGEVFTFGLGQGTWYTHYAFPLSKLLYEKLVVALPILNKAVVRSLTSPVDFK